MPASCALLGASGCSCSLSRGSLPHARRLNTFRGLRPPHLRCLQRLRFSSAPPACPAAFAARLFQFPFCIKCRFCTVQHALRSPQLLLPSLL